MSKAYYEHGDNLSGGYVSLEKNPTNWRKGYRVGTGYILCDEQMAHKYNDEDVVILHSWKLPGSAIKTGLDLIFYGILCKLKNLSFSLKDV